MATINDYFLTLPVWNIEETTGYKPQTTFWQDFCIADRFGLEAIRDTYNRSNGFKDDPVYWTELSMVLNHKIWQWYKKDPGYAELYNDLWEESQKPVEDWSEEDKRYYYRTID